jgi:endonuclease/exonuclease/phosphatase family metal-dependent hydrolase
MGNRSVGAVVNIGGRDVYVASVHLDSNNYFSKPLNEYQADGAAGPQRRGQVRAILKTVDTLAPGLPVVLAGDWNTASHFDWSWWVAPYPPAGHAGDTTPGPAGIQPAAPGNWAGTLELGAAGYHDAGKDFYKQVVTGDTPRSTWIPLGYTPVGYEHERIDMIWYRGNLTPSNFDTLDETNTPGISVWSTDHRGVVVTFSGL